MAFHRLTRLGATLTVVSMMSVASSAARMRVATLSRVKPNWRSPENVRTALARLEERAGAAHRVAACC